jgi:hypothetical protein
MTTKKTSRRFIVTLRGPATTGRTSCGSGGTVTRGEGSASRHRGRGRGRRRRRTGPEYAALGNDAEEFPEIQHLTRERDLLSHGAVKTLRLRPIFQAVLLGSASLGTLGCGGSTSLSDTGDGGGNPDAYASCTPTVLFTRPGVSGCASVNLTPPCGLPAPDGGAVLTQDQCALYCTPFLDGGTLIDCTLEAASATEPEFLSCQMTPCQTGRRPGGLASSGRPRSQPGASPRALAEFFAEAAYLEEASVAAFRVLRGELRALRAPATLVRRADRAARDEVRHTRVMTRLARLAGVEPARARVDRRPRRPLLPVAIENAVEGCVRETFGALVASYQAERARDPRIARAMRAVARDETRHAELAWAVDRWSQGRLPAQARREVREAMSAAFVELEADLARGRETPPELRLAAGLPSAAAAHALARGLRRALML